MKILLNESLSPKPKDFLQVFRLELLQEYTIFSKDIIKIYSTDILGYSKSKTISIGFFFISVKNTTKILGTLQESFDRFFQKASKEITKESIPKFFQEFHKKIASKFVQIFFENYHNYLVQENFQRLNTNNDKGGNSCRDLGGEIWTFEKVLANSPEKILNHG